MRWVIIFFKAHIIVDFGSGTITQKRLSNTTVSIEIWHPNNNGNLMFPKISKLMLSMKAKKNHISLVSQKYYGAETHFSAPSYPYFFLLLLLQTVSF